MNRNHRTQPRRVDFSDLTGPDIKIVEAIRYGKGYKAAGSLSNSTVGQVSYRLKKINDRGILLSPKVWRESSLPGDVKKIRELDRQFKLVDKLLQQIRSKLK